MPRFLFPPIYSFSLWHEERAPHGDETIHLSLANSEYILRILISYKESENLEVNFIPQGNISPNHLSFVVIHSLLKHLSNKYKGLY